MSTPSEAQVLDALRPIIDPDFGRSIVDLGFVRDIAIEGGRVAFKIVLTTPACPVKAEFERTARERVAALPGVRDVQVTMGADTRGRGAARPVPAGDVLPGVRNTHRRRVGQGRRRQEQHRREPRARARRDGRARRASSTPTSTARRSRRCSGSTSVRARRSAASAR